MLRWSASLCSRLIFLSSIFLSLPLALPSTADDAPRRTTDPVDRGAPVVVSDAAMKLHRESLVFDGHNDLPWEVRTKFGASFDAADIAKPQPKLQTDIKRLRKGGIVCILIDRDIQKRGMELELCGHKARFPTGAADLALRTNSVLMPGWAHRTDGFKIRADVGPPLELTRTGNHDEDVRINSQRLLDLFCDQLRHDPGLPPIQ